MVCVSNITINWGNPSPVSPEVCSRLKPIGFISSARMALGKLLWRLGLCTIQSDNLCHAELNGLIVTKRVDPLSSQCSTVVLTLL